MRHLAEDTHEGLVSTESVDDAAALPTQIPLVRLAGVLSPHSLGSIAVGCLAYTGLLWLQEKAKVPFVPGNNLFLVLLSAAIAIFHFVRFIHQRVRLQFQLLYTNKKDRLEALRLASPRVRPHVRAVGALVASIIAFIAGLTGFGRSYFGAPTSFASVSSTYTLKELIDFGIVTVAFAGDAFPKAPRRTAILTFPNQLIAPSESWSCEELSNRTRKVLTALNVTFSGPYSDSIQQGRTQDWRGIAQKFPDKEGDMEFFNSYSMVQSIPWSDPLPTLDVLVVNAKELESTVLNMPLVFTVTTTTRCDPPGASEVSWLLRGNKQQVLLHVLKTENSQ